MQFRGGGFLIWVGEDGWGRGRVVEVEFAMGRGDEWFSGCKMGEGVSW